MYVAIPALVLMSLGLMLWMHEGNVAIALFVGFVCGILTIYDYNYG